MKLFKYLSIVLAYFTISNECFAQVKKAEKENGRSSELSVQIDDYISEITDRYNIPGIQLAVIKNGNVIHKNNYGKANLEHNVSVTDSSIFRVYSLTKPFVAVAIFQLVEQGKLTLEDEISIHLDDLPPSWQSVKIKNLLRHSSGVPEIDFYDKLPEDEAKQKVYQDAMKFKQGKRFDYNQTNFWLLQRIIEKLSNEKIEDYIIDNQFSNRSVKENVFFSTDSRDIIKNRVSLYFPFETGNMQIVNHYREDYLTSSNGLNLNSNELINWSLDFRNNEFITQSSKDNMWVASKFKNDFRKWAYGWNEYILNGHKSYGFSGSMVTVYRNFPEDDLSIIYLTNGFEYWYDIETVVNHIAYLTNNDIVDLKVLAYETLLKSAQKNMSGFNSEFEELRGNSKFENFKFEGTLNNIGYTFLNNYKDTHRAIEIFDLNTQLNPKSSNAFDSLGEAYERNNDFENAILNYSKAKSLSNDKKYKSNLNKKINKLSKITNANNVYKK